MKAFVTKYHTDGKPLLGSSNVSITPNYQSLVNMKRYFLNKLQKGKYFVEVFINWDNRYGKPDFTFDWAIY